MVFAAMLAMGFDPEALIKSISPAAFGIDLHWLTPFLLPLPVTDMMTGPAESRLVTSELSISRGGRSGMYTNGVQPVCGRVLVPLSFTLTIQTPAASANFINLDTGELQAYGLSDQAYPVEAMTAMLAVSGSAARTARSCGCSSTCRPPPAKNPPPSSLG